MKKIVLSLLAVAAMGLSANAQQVVKFGPKAGVNFANMNGIDDSNMKTSFHVGAFAEVFFTDKFAVQPELLYSMQGGMQEGDISFNFNGVEMSAEGERDITLSYINIPVMAKYYVIDGLAVEAGPYIGFLMKAESNVTATASSQGQTGQLDETYDIKDSMKSDDFGLGLGASYNLDNGFFGGARYNLGLTDMFEENEGDAIKNGVIQISVGYKF